MGKIKGLAHVGLYVSDADIEVKFYTEVLGFKLIWENVNKGDDGDYIVKFVQLGDCVIEIVQFPKPITLPDGHFDHIALDVENLDEVMEDLKAKGIEYDEGSYCVNPGTFEHGSRWVLFRGPSGEHLELNEKFKA